MATVEPIPDEPAALATVAGDRTLLLADYHAGVEAGLRYERGVQVPSRAVERRERLCSLLEGTRADRLVVLGDLMHSIGGPGGAERGELEVLFESLPPIEVTLVKGNHDGAIESWLGGSAGGGSVTDAADDIDVEFTVLPGSGARLGPIGICHGHSWPAPEVLEAEVVCMGHEHPCVRLEDEVGGSRVEPAWLRGRLSPVPFRPRPEYESIEWLGAPVDDEGVGDVPSGGEGVSDVPAGGEGVSDVPAGDEGVGGVPADDERIREKPAARAVAGEPEGASTESATDAAPSLVVLPAFNDLVGGTWVNVPGQSFLAPFLPAGLAEADAYLLDGTLLGPYRSI